MSAMKVIDEITEKVEKCFYSNPFVGVLPESDTNRWNYKFTWAPRNVVLAGQGTAKFIQEGTYKYIPYAIYLEEQNFLKWKIMVALRLILTEIH
jgi:saccharopine dehydrogenase-like NADP-dependent oxidoreductase